MIDLHLHTNYSDGADSVTELLENAEKLKLEYISITDHDNCKAYKELKKEEIRNKFSGTIIPGIEIKCAYGKRLIEVLGYNIDTDKMQEWADEYYKDKTKEKIQSKYFNMLYEKCKKLNLTMREKDEIQFDSKTEWASVKIYNEIKSYQQNREKLPSDLWEEFNTFSKKYCGDPQNIFYIDKTQDYPSIELAISKIKECNGLAFYPHLFIYKWATDRKLMIDELLKKYPVDGIECMHSEFSEEEIEYMKKLCDERGYLMSGGSDYHGKNKVNIKMAIGKGNLNIQKEMILNWLDEKKLV
ncbi:MAG: PHP domain-containing protein [Clostridia bacterium]